MGLTAGQKLTDIKVVDRYQEGSSLSYPVTVAQVDTVFVGSCTNGRIEDLRAAAKIAAGRRVAEGVQALIVPGSGLVKQMAEDEGQLFLPWLSFLYATLIPPTRIRSGQDLHCGGLRVARAWVLDVFGDERRHPPAWPALCLDQQQKLRGEAGPRWQDPLSQP